MFLPFHYSLTLRITACMWDHQDWLYHALHSADSQDFQILLHHTYSHTQLALCISCFDLTSYILLTFLEFRISHQPRPYILNSSLNVLSNSMFLISSFNLQSFWHPYPCTIESGVEGDVLFTLLCHFSYLIFSLKYYPLSLLVSVIYWSMHYSPLFLEGFSSWL